MKERIQAIVTALLAVQPKTDRNGQPQERVWKQKEQNAAVAYAAADFFAEMEAENRARVTKGLEPFTRKELAIKFLDLFVEKGFPANLSQFQQVLDDEPVNSPIHVRRPKRESVNTSDLPEID
jgi:hypothetical protein